MIEKFNGIFYLIIFIIHFVGFGAYAYQMIIGNQKFRAKFEIDETAATIMRMAGAIFFGSFLMALYIMFVRPNGVEGTWAFFNLIFVQNICVLVVNTYSLKIDKTGVKNDSNEAIIAPLVFTILSAVLIFGLSDKIYIQSQLGKGKPFSSRNFLLNIFVEYLSLLSQRIVTIVFPGPSSLPILIAPAILTPQLVPKLKPSFCIKS